MSKFFSKSKDPGSAPPVDSVGAMLSEAQRQGWLVGKELRFIPELESIYKSASEYFASLVEESEPKLRETMTFHSSRYLFAKAVEGVILWGMSSDGNVSVFFHPRHLEGEVETEVPRHLHNVVIDTMSLGESLFKVHQNWVIAAQKGGRDFCLRDETQKTLRWIPKFGINYGLFKNYHTLR